LANGGQGTTSRALKMGVICLRQDGQSTSVVCLFLTPIFLLQRKGTIKSVYKIGVKKFGNEKQHATATEQQKQQQQTLSLQ
jgi:hypothetical protein